MKLAPTLPYLGDDLLFLSEVEHASSDLNAPILFRASEHDKLTRLEKYGTDRGGFPGKKVWRGGGRLHEEVILATTAEDIRRGAREERYSTSFKKFPGIPDPLLLLYDATKVEKIGDREYAFLSNPREALLRVFPIRHVPMPFGWMSSEEGMGYRTLVERAGAKVVEIGTWLGKSTSYVARVSSLTCVDHFEGSTDTYNAAYREMLARNDIRAAFEKHLKLMEANVRLLVESSIHAANQFQDRSLDLVFLDGSHDEAAVRADIQAWFPKIRTGGILAGHDYNSDHPGVVNAVTHLRPELGPGSLYHIIAG